MMPLILPYSYRCNDHNRLSEGFANYVPSGTGIYLAGNEAPPGTLKQGSSLPGEESTFRLSEVLGSLHKESRSGDGPPPSGWP